MSWRAELGSHTHTQACLSGLALTRARGQVASVEPGEPGEPGKPGKPGEPSGRAGERSSEGRARTEAASSADQRRLAAPPASASSKVSLTH